MTPEQVTLAGQFIGTIIGAIMVSALVNWQRLRPVNKKVKLLETHTESQSGRIDTLEEKNRRLEADLNREKLDRQRLERDYIILKQDRDDHVKRLDDAHMRIDALIEIGKRQDDQIRASQLTNAELKGRVDEQRETIKLLTANNEKLQGRIVELQLQATAGNVRETHLNEQLASTNAELTTARSEVESLRIKVATLETQLSEQEKAFKDQISQLKSQLAGKALSEAAKQAKPAKVEPNNGASTKVDPLITKPEPSVSGGL